LVGLVALGHLIYGLGPVKLVVIAATFDVYLCRSYSDRNSDYDDENNDYNYNYYYYNSIYNNCFRLYV